MKRVRVGAWQMEPRPGDVGRNLGALERVLAGRRARDLDLLVAPEMFATGWLPPRGDAQQRDRLVEERLCSFAREFGLHLATSLMTRRGARAYNTFKVVGPTGRVLGSYDKVHLWDKEAKRITPGTTPRTIRTPHGTVGGLVCYDVEFPEMARRLAVSGTEMFLVPSAFYTSTSWDIMTRARALENGCFLVAANQHGGRPSQPHNGESRIVGPRGQVLAAAPRSGDALVTHTLDPREVKRARAWAPFLRDLRPNLLRRA